MWCYFKITTTSWPLHECSRKAATREEWWRIVKRVTNPEMATPTTLPRVWRPRREVFRSNSNASMKGLMYHLNYWTETQECCSSTGMIISTAPRIPSKSSLFLLIVLSHWFHNSLQNKINYSFITLKKLETKFMFDGFLLSSKCGLSKLYLNICELDESRKRGYIAFIIPIKYYNGKPVIRLLSK